MAIDKALTVIDPETGEKLEVATDGWEAPTQQELGQLKRFSDIGQEPILIVQIGWTEGKRQGIEGKPCALIAYLQASTGRELHGAYSFSESVVNALRNMEASGKATPQRPLACQAGRSGPTSNGYFVDKILPLGPPQEAILRKAFS